MKNIKYVGFGDRRVFVDGDIKESAGEGLTQVFNKGEVVEVNNELGKLLLGGTYGKFEDAGDEKPTEQGVDDDQPLEGDESDSDPDPDANDGDPAGKGNIDSFPQTGANTTTGPGGSTAGTSASGGSTAAGTGTGSSTAGSTTGGSTRRRAR